MPSNIKIGSTVGNIAAIDALFHKWYDRQPRCMPINNAEHVNVGNGARLGMGWLEQVWHWGFLSEGMWDALKAYESTTVYVDTITNTGAVVRYTATLVWPEEEPEHWAGRVLEADITLRSMVSV